MAATTCLSDNASDLRSDIWALRESPGFFHRRPSAPFQLTTGPMSLDSPVPGLDGKRLFAHGLLSRGELVRYESRSRQFAPFLSGISAGELDFSRDGKWVAYVSYPERTLWRSRIDGSEGLQLTYAPVVAFLPRWSPDGTQIAYVDLQTGTALENLPDIGAGRNAARTACQEGQSVGSDLVSRRKTNLLWADAVSRRRHRENRH